VGPAVARRYRCGMDGSGGIILMDRYRNAVRDKFDRRASTYIHNYRLPRSISQDAKVQRLKAAKAWSRPTSRDFPWPPRPSISSSHSGFSATSPTRKGSLQKPAESCAPEVT